TKPAATAGDHASRQALAMSTIAFTVCFAVWTIFSIIGVRIKEEMGLSDTAFGLLVGTPILSGSLVRVVLGVWTDRYGGRLVYTATILSAAGATFLLGFAHPYTPMLVPALRPRLARGSLPFRLAFRSRLL